jgi:[ribosomal protein S18]-alanine N-acetyltransferase
MCTDITRPSGIAAQSRLARIDPVLRDARPEDLPRLWELDRICFEPGIAYSQREMRRFLLLPGARSVLAEDGGRLAGFAMGHPDPPDVARVVTLDVHPDFRRHGLGRRLLRELLARLVDAGSVRVVLEVDVRNSGAIEFYRQEGFRKTRRLRSYYGRGLDGFEMTKNLF